MSAGSSSPLLEVGPRRAERRDGPGLFERDVPVERVGTRFGQRFRHAEHGTGDDAASDAGAGERALPLRLAHGSTLVHRLSPGPARL